jgi:sugar phosphate isomerase/epimerase
VRGICLDHLTLSDLTALELIETAGALGCQAVSLFVTPLPLGPYRDLIADLPARREVQSALRTHGLGVGIVEPFMLAEATDWDLMRRTAELTAELGGTINALGFDADRARLTDSIGRLAEIAGDVGVKLAIEAFPLCPLRTQSEALALAIGAGDHVGVTVDTLHVVRMGGAWEHVRALPPERIFHVQVNDGPLEPPEDRYLEATKERLPPGDGEFGLRAMLALVPQSATLAVEAPFRAPPGMTPLERGRIAVEGLRRLLEPAPAG